MNRKSFIKLLALWPLTGTAMNLNKLYNFSESLSYTERMPLLFLGHGSPMNAIQENEFVAGFRSMASQIRKPNAILCVSAHWETKGTMVTAMAAPRTIHDFGGFPKELYAVQYPAPGDPMLAAQVKALVTQTPVGLDDQWGLDHGAWSVIKHLYPDADVPVIQLSLDYSKPPEYHYELARELATLRTKGVLIIGSGNMVHNLGLVDWTRLNAVDYAHDWALEAREKMLHLIATDDHRALIHYNSNGRAFQLAIPTPEHYLPLLYVLALKGEKDTVSFFNDKAVGGALTMTSVKVGG